MSELNNNQLFIAMLVFQWILLSTSTNKLRDGRVAMIHDISEKVVQVFESLEEANKSRRFEPSSSDISDSIKQGTLCKGHYWKMWTDVAETAKADFEEMIDPSSGAANKTGFDVAATHPVYTSYSADRMGNVYNRETEKILKGNLEMSGYIRNCFSCNGVKNRMYAHIFIFECFVAQKNNKTHDINHMNGLKNCNELSNLELLNRKDHVLHSLPTGIEHPIFQGFDEFLKNGVGSFSVRRSSHLAP